MQPFRLLNLICPIVLLCAGFCIKLRPVSDKRKHKGNDTPTSEESQEHRNHPKRVIPNIYIPLGFILLIVEIILNIVMIKLQLSVKVSIAIGSCIGFGFIYYALYYIDSQIERKFPDKDAE